MGKSIDVLKEAFRRGYTVDRMGAVSSPRGRVLKTCIGSTGYLQVDIYLPDWGFSKGFPVAVHRMVAFSKYGDEMFADGVEVRHLNGVKLDCTWENIAIGTRRQNIMDMTPELRSRGKGIPGSGHPMAKLTEVDVRRIHSLAVSGKSCASIAGEYGIAVSTVSGILTGKSWSHLGMDAIHVKASGGRHWNSVLTEETVSRIRERLASGDRASDLAREYGVSQSTIADIKHRRTWDHVD